MKYLVKRNLLIFFRDRGSVFFSLLAVFIIIGLYVLFLGDMLINNMQEMPGARFLMDSWIMAGLIAVTPITTSLGAMSSIIVDKKYGMFKDFAASPIKRSSIALGYIASGFLISLILTLITYVLAEVYIIAFGGNLLPFTAMIKVLGMILFTTASSSIMMFYLVSLFKSINAFSAASTVVGTLIGFLTGIYIPVGSLPPAVQTAVKLFPPSHGAVILRRIMMGQAEKITFRGAPAAALDAFRLEMGASFRVGDIRLNSYASLLYMALFMAGFTVLALIRIKRKGD
ncbi:MAG TPA: ABC transporter permease [Clostridia bacterium]|nr:ABC transporter permease [Clostridia bacterium]